MVKLLCQIRSIKEHLNIEVAQVTEEMVVRDIFSIEIEKVFFYSRGVFKNIKSIPFVFKSSSRNPSEELQNAVETHDGG